MENYFQDNIDCFKKVQEVLLLKRPVVLVIAVVLLNLALFFYKKLSSNFYALAVFIALVHLIYKSFVEKYVSGIIEKLFASNVEDDENAPNRIRSPKEVAALISKVFFFVPIVVKMLAKFAKDESFLGRLIWIGVLFVFFIIFTLIDMFWIIAFALNAALLLPAILTEKHVYEFINKQKQKTD